MKCFEQNNIKCFEQPSDDFGYNEYPVNEKSSEHKRLDKIFENNTSGIDVSYSEYEFPYYQVSLQQTELSYSEIKDLEKASKFKFYKVANGNQYFIKTWWIKKY